MLKRKKKEESKLFVGGYRDEFQYIDEFGEQQGNENFGIIFHEKYFDVYTLGEVLQLGFVNSIYEWFDEISDEEKGYVPSEFEDEEDEVRTWDDLSFDEKVKFVLEYTCDDELAALYYFETEEKALDFKENQIELIKKFKEEFEFERFLGSITDDKDLYVRKKRNSISY